MTSSDTYYYTTLPAIHNHQPIIRCSYGMINGRFITLFQLRVCLKLEDVGSLCPLGPLQLIRAPRENACHTKMPDVSRCGSQGYLVPMFNPAGLDDSRHWHRLRQVWAGPRDVWERRVQETEKVLFQRVLDKGAVTRPGSA